MNFFGKIFKITFWSIIIAEAFSFLAYFFPAVNKAGFIFFVLLTIILASKKLEWGLYLVLAELFIASKGYLFAWSVGEQDISVRLGIFIALFIVWLIKALISKDLALKKSKLFWPYIALFLALIGGIIWGYFQGNALSHIFFDVNGYFYYGLVFIFFMVLKSWAKVEAVMQVFFASLLAMGLKTLTLLYIFSHKIGSLNYIYRWVRTTGVGEITLMDSGFYRIFFQSHIYFLFAFIILALVLIKSQDLKLTKKKVYGLLAFLILSSTILFLSYSRSFWLGWLVAIILLTGWLIFYNKTKIRALVKISSQFLLIIIVSLGLVWGITNFPWPDPDRSVSLLSLVEERTEIEGEVAAGSRFNLLGPLKDQILSAPLIGTGFGTTVTYATEDPRALESNPSGLFTTFLFEWGYLDTITETGFIGLMIYLWLLFVIFWQGYKIIRTRNPEFRTQNIVQSAFLLSFLALLAVHFTTPYLNHPLGIGWALLCSAVLSLKPQIKNA